MLLTGNRINIVKKSDAKRSAKFCGPWQSCLLIFALVAMVLDQLPLFAQDTARQVKVTAGGEIRSRYEKYWNDNWGGAPKDNNGYLLHRFLIFGNINFSNKILLHAELKSALHSNLDIPPRPVDQDNLDLQELYVEYYNKNASVKLGRQRLTLGSGRLIDPREYTNALLSFDGLKFMMQNKSWQLMAFAVRQSKMAFGIFDNAPDPDRSLWCIYVTKYTGKTVTDGIDLYYLGQERNKISYTFGDYRDLLNEGPYREVRHTIGFRIYNHVRNFDYDIEPIYQFGSYSKNRETISAWRIAATAGYTFNHFKLKPRLYLNVDISSGDKDSTDRRLNTFHPAYPDILDATAANLSGIKIGINTLFSNKLSIDLLEWFFWRTSAQDGIYGFLGFPYRAAGLSNTKYIGNSPGIIVAYPLNQHFNLVAVYATEFVEGGFLSKQPPGVDLSYAGLSITYKY